MDTKQSIQAKQGEIKYRRTLAEQEVNGKMCIPEAFSREEITAVIAASIEGTRRVFKKIVARSIPISPFLELGAERGHRSFCLCNEFDAQGFAFDLSLDALQFGERLMMDFNFTEAPVRICGDAYNLPFRNSTFPFVFCFATLHHVPDPQPLVKEVLRVLQHDGYFYFDGEPTRGQLAITLWTRRGYKLSAFERLLSRLGILGFVSEGGDIEREYGILENTFSLDTWISLTEPFEEVEMQVNQTLKIQVGAPRFSFVKDWLGRLLGGVTTALCRVKKDEVPVVTENWLHMLRCPTCSTEKESFELVLLPESNDLQCHHCGTLYPNDSGVILLMKKDLQQQLYPEQVSVQG